MKQKTPTLTRQQIVDALHDALHELPAVRAAWLGGSDATGRTDRFSDIDCLALVEDDAVELEAAMKARLPHLVARFELFHIFVNKAIWRQDPPDAISTYHAMTLRPLVELLRMRHCPDRYDFGMRYLQRDLTPDVYQKIEPLFYCDDLARLERNQEAAVALFRNTLGELRDMGLVA